MLGLVRVTACRPMAAVLLVGGTLASMIGGGLRAPEASAATPQLVVPCAGPSGGQPGLASAIDQANGSGGGTIILTPGCTYTLTQADGSNAGCYPCNAIGLPNLLSNITIEGNGATIERAPSAPAFGLIEVDNVSSFLGFGLYENVAVDLTGLTLRGGLQTNLGGRAILFPLSGGAIENVGGLLKLDGVTVTGNTAAGAGGGIDNTAGYNSYTLQPVAGTLIASASVVTGNRSMGTTTFPTTGGGINNNSGNIASVAGSVVVGNQPNNCTGLVVGCVG
jgi:hypothetical protein